MTTRKVQKLIYNIFVICLLLGAIIYVCSRFIHLGVEYTDNAQVKQHITPVNTRVSGFIQKICFEEYQPVHKGDTLLIIEDSEFRLRLAQAEADLENARSGQQATSAGIATTQNNLSVSDEENISLPGSPSPKHTFSGMENLHFSYRGHKSQI